MQSYSQLIYSAIVAESSQREYVNELNLNFM